MDQMETALEHSFSFLSGYTTEDLNYLRKKKIFNWNDFLQKSNLLKESPPDFILEVYRDGWRDRIQEWVLELEEAKNRLNQRDAVYFFHKIPYKESWKLFPIGESQFLFLDIETTGIYSSHDITSIAVYYQKKVHTFVRTKNLDDFLDFLPSQYILISYNGFRFDVPFIERAFSIKLLPSHIDIMHEMHSLGIKGGLKGAEKYLGIYREEDVDFEGSMAVRLWNHYVETDDEDTLSKLVRYNIADTVNLYHLFEYSHKVKSEQFFKLLKAYL